MSARSAMENGRSSRTGVRRRSSAYSWPRMGTATGSSNTSGKSTIWCAARRRATRKAVRDGMVASMIRSDSLTSGLLFLCLWRNPAFMLNLEGRVAAVFGLANKRSIAWGIAQKLQQAGCRLAISYQNERMKAEAHELIADLPGAEAFQCDVSNDEEIHHVFAQLKERYGKLDALVHSIGFAPAEELKNDFIQTTRDGFRVARDVSVYSLIALSRSAAPLMTDGGSIITLTYYGAEKVV